MKGKNVLHVFRNVFVDKASRKPACLIEAQPPLAEDDRIAGDAPVVQHRADYEMCINAVRRHVIMQTRPDRHGAGSMQHKQPAHQSQRGDDPKDE